MIDRETKLFILIFGFIGIVFLGLFVYLLPMQIKRDNKAQEYAQEHGCKCLGHARDMNSVYFLDCDGEIKLVRVK